MADKLKYSTTQPTLPGLRTDDFVLGTGDGNYGPTSTTSYLNGFTAPEGGYVVYTLGLSNTPIGWVASNDTELIDISRHLGNTSLTSKDAKVYLAGLTDTWVFNSTPSNIVTDGLVLEINAKNLTSYPEASTTAYDVSGKGNDITLVNGPNFDPAGAINFDGVDDYGDSPSIIGGLTNYSGEFFFNTRTNPNGSEQWLGSQYVGSAGRLIFDLYVDQTLRNFINGSGIAGGQIIQTDKWYHAVFTRNSDGFATIYVNGELDNSGTISNVAVLNTNYQIAGETILTRWFDGRISENRLYNKALTEAEIKQNYYGGPIVTDGLLFSTDAGNLVAYESNSVITYNLTGSLQGDLINGIGYSPSYGGAWQFDGTDEGIQFFSSFDLSNYSSLTYEGWIKGQGVTTLDRWFSGTNGNSANAYHYPDLAIAPSGLLHYIHPSLGTSWENTNIIIPTTKYNHIAFTFYNDGKVDLFINGALVFTRQHTPGTFPSISSFMIGNRFDRNGEAILGDISIVRIYNRALTPGEVQQNFEAHRSRFGV